MPKAAEVVVVARCRTKLSLKSRKRRRQNLNGATGSKAARPTHGQRKVHGGKHEETIEGAGEGAAGAGAGAVSERDPEARKILAMQPLPCPEFLKPSTQMMESHRHQQRSQRPPPPFMQDALMGALLPHGENLKWRGIFGRAFRGQDDGAGHRSGDIYGRDNVDDDNQDSSDSCFDKMFHANSSKGFDYEEGGRLGLSAAGYEKLEKFGFAHLQWNNLFAGCIESAVRERSPL